MITPINCREQTRQCFVNQANIDIILSTSQPTSSLGTNNTYSFYPLTQNLADSYQNFSSLVVVSGSAGYDYNGFKFKDGKYLAHVDYDLSGLTGGGGYNTSIYSFGFQFICSANNMCLWYGGTSAYNISVNVNSNKKIVINKVFNNVLTSIETTQDIKENDWNTFMFQFDGTTSANCWVDINGEKIYNSVKSKDPASNNFIRLGNNKSNNFYIGSIRNYRIQNRLFGLDEIENLKNIHFSPTFYLYDVNRKNKINVSSLITPAQSNGITLKGYPSSEYVSLRVPAVLDGVYVVEYCTLNSKYVTNRIKLVNNVPKVDYYYKETFNDKNQVINKWDLAHKKWGGVNGGVSLQNVNYDTTNNQIVFTSCGDIYSGDIKGVDTIGRITSATSRIGACLVSKDYYGPGIYEFIAKWPSNTGVVFAFWNFHYEEIYPTDERYQSFIDEGLHESGNVVDGYYIVRNHEIDIETPTALKTDPNQENASFDNMRVNSWIGELRNWSVPNNDVPTNDPMYNITNDPEYWSEYSDNFIFSGKSLNDGNWHKVSYDWDITNNYIKFYVDDVLVKTITNYIPNIAGKVWIGTWFPSASTKWAGAQANWNTQECYLKEFTFTPHPNQSVRYLGESFPDDGLYSITNSNII